MARTLLPFIVILIATLASSSARGDLIRLLNGGEIRGKLIKRSVDDPEVIIETLTGATLTMDRANIEFVSLRPLEAEEYETRSHIIPDTVEAHLELAEWCRKQHLKSERNEQLEAVIRLDPYHEEARKALGHVEKDGEWMTRDEYMASRGYIRVGARYLTQQQIDLREKTAEQRQAEKEWYGKVRLWVVWLTGDNGERQTEALTELKAIDDATALPALGQHMGSHEDIRIRRLLISVLTNMPDESAVPALVGLSLNDIESEIRSGSVAAIKTEQYTAAVPLMVQALSSNENNVVNRAADGLASIGDPRTVPALMEALITNHRMTILVPDKSATSIGAGPNGASIGDPNTMSQYLPPEVQAMAANGQLPYGAIVIPPAGPKRPLRKAHINVDIKNTSVLAALKKLTSQDFGYDERTWKLWWSARSEAPLPGVVGQPG